LQYLRCGVFAPDAGGGLSVQLSAELFGTESTLESSPMKFKAPLLHATLASAAAAVLVSSVSAFGNLGGDFNCYGVVNANDIAVPLGAWGACP